MKMKHFIILLIGVFVFFSSCSSQVKPETKTETKSENNQKLPQEINSKQAFDMLKKDSSVIVVDVRTPMEFNQGHIKGAVNINISSRDFKQKVDALNEKGKAYLVYCRTHNRSTGAVKYMRENGFTNVYQMMDGFSGWSRNKLPMEK